MPTIKLYDPAQPYLGLWVHGGVDAPPSGAFRRLSAVERLPRRSLRSRNGSTAVASQDAHSVVRYNDNRYAGVTTTFKRLDTEADIKTGLNGNRLHFGKMAPSAGKVAYLYAANGGSLFKVFTDHTVTSWGITAPADGFTAALASEKTTQIDSCDNSGTWTGSNATLATETTIKQEGSASVHATVAASTVATVTKSITVDLSQHSDLSASADEDFIAFWIRIDKPANVDSIQLIFSLNNTTFADNTYSVSLEAVDTGEQLSENEVGLGFLAGSAETELTYIKAPTGITSGAVSLSIPAGEAASLLEALGQAKISTVNGVWTRMRIPKTSFGRSGTGAYGWADVLAVQWVINTNDRGAVEVYFDDLKLLGEAGLQGQYKYLITYYDSVTGTRSNPNATPVEVGPSTRQKINLSSLPTTSSDTQVDTVEIWRTVGNGTFYFKAGSVSLGTSTFADTVADAYFMDTRSGASVLEDLELPRDNTVPDATTSDVTPEPVNGVTWTLNSGSGKTNRAYYSPVGRPEGVAGFIEVSEPDDPCQRLAVWNALYVFTEKHLYRIDGTNPYIATPVVGVPGTVYPDTVVVTPVGIAYCAADGPRLFDGARSVRIAAESVGGLFEGDTLEDISAITPVVAGYAREEYLVSDETVTLGFNLQRAGLARNLGIDMSAMWYEQDTEKLLATAGGAVVLFEDPGTTQDGATSLTYTVQFGAVLSDSDTPAYVRRIYFDINSNSQSLTVSKIVDGTATTLGTVNTASRSLANIAVAVNARTFSLRLSASISSAVELFGAYADVYVPGNDAP